MMGSMLKTDEREKNLKTGKFENIFNSTKDQEKV